eukprot:GFUD01007623.1.p1 GENE.GFUD01007623.1~~GFUD01007623.1.p1  ORF type:complete len:628 (-),score=196.56 GFUD01007623.1:149-2032(-)
MPVRLIPSSLYSLSSQGVATLLLAGCKSLDNKWQQPIEHENPSSLIKAPFGLPHKSPGREEVYLHLSPEHRTLLDWLSNLPDRVIEDVVSNFLAKLETHLLDDMDNKLILTMINIEKMKMKDFFFGVHSLLSLVQGFQLHSLHFSKRLWFCLWQYGEITSSKHLSDTLCCSLPGLSCLTSLNIPHVADDRIVYTVTRYLNSLITLDVSNSRVSDRGLRFLAASVNFSRPKSPSSSAIRNLADMMEDPKSSHKAEILFQPQSRVGCPKLEQLNLQSCDNVTEKGVIYVLEHLLHLRHLEYHQKSSVLEILIKSVSTITDEERSGKVFRLTEVEHGFPYGLSPLSDQMTQLAGLLPHLTTITLVTMDSAVSLLALFPHLSKITVELEDCLGDGFLELLSKLGDQLEEVCVSCSSDPEATLSLDQVEGPAAQQGQLFNLAIVMVGLLARRVRKLSVSGCGLVSSTAVATMGLQEKIGHPSWLRRQSDQWFSSLSSLILMSYEDSLPAMAVHSGLIKSVLVAAKDLKILNLEGSFGTFFSDSYFCSILSFNSLTNLSILDICVSEEGGLYGRIPLTWLTVQQLLASCKRLRELRISDWRVTDLEFKELQKMVTDNNWDLLITRKVRDLTDS